MIDSILASGVLPDFLIRAGIRSFLKKKLKNEAAGGPMAVKNRLDEFVRVLSRGPIVIAADDANRQHYEVPTEFYKLVLGEHLKYSGAYWRPLVPPQTRPYPQRGKTGLDQAEQDMLELAIERAEIRDGMTVLELGCGWGSFSLYLAEKFPRCQITALSNSATQKNHIDEQIQKRGLKNLNVVTLNIVDFKTAERFDRIVSIEMLEHMRNYDALFGRIASWMKEDGKFFAHIFCHKHYAYAFDPNDPHDWIARHFFTGGIMPHETLFYSFQNDLKIQYRWRVDGTHYQKTCRAWLRNMDKNWAQIRPVFEKTYGAENVRRWRANWRVFFMACEELFGYQGGHEWFVAHYLFVKK